ncbi:MAG TPA: RND transporter, partial [Pseudomonas sp.]|nr:RND transporter [Pseudomonas sp.]
MALSLAISGCIGTGGIAPQGRVLSVNSLATDEAIQSAARDARWPTAQWWQTYGDPQLNRWVDLATQNSPSLAMAAARVRQAQSMVVVAHAGELPNAQLDAAVGRKDWSDNIYYGASFRDKLTWNNTATLSLAYNVDLWDRNK